MRMKVKSLAKNVAATGTPEALSLVQIQSSYVKIKAKTTNTQPVLIGDVSGQEYQLAPGTELLLTELTGRNGVSDNISLKDIYVKVAVNGEGVTVLYSAKV